MTYRKLASLLKKNSSEYSLRSLKKAYEFAHKAHLGQKRLSGEKYITHPLSVAAILLEWGLPQSTLEAALLHDVVEDTPYTITDIRKEFGNEIAFLVDSVTKIRRVRLSGNAKNKDMENLRKMFIATAKDIRVVILRMADRYHNMLTIEHLPASRRFRFADETIKIYAPLAERLSMGDIKGKLEDLAFPIVDPRGFNWLAKHIDYHLPSVSAGTKKILKTLKHILKKNKIDAQISGRSKHLFSLYNKLLRKGIDRDFSKIHDLLAVRIITSNKSDCYHALGLVHENFKPVPYIGISDFIAQPKPNGYRSIHTKVFDNQGRVVEVQIRTQTMHYQAEYGPAAHYVYTQIKNTGQVDDSVLEAGLIPTPNKKMIWVKQLSQWKEILKNKNIDNTAFKLDVLSRHIFVFSPLGDVYELPLDATPVDFAFAIHTDLGLYIASAKVNQKLTPLSHHLKSGDVVEIIKSKHPRRPSPDWIKFVKSSKIKAKIRQTLAEK